MNDTFSLLQKYTGISKYSKSEVITPQWVVSDMVDLLPQEVFNPDATFFDPAVKSGRFLIEIYHRLMNSEQMKQAFPNEQDRHKHIIEKQLFGFATSSTAATVVRKDLYDDPLNTGNIRFTSDRLTKELVQGAFNNMKFDVVIGNPPYNNDIYLDFVQLCFDKDNKLWALNENGYACFITPAKWQAKGGKRNEDFRNNVVPYMSKIVFYPDCKEVFDIAETGGISYFLIRGTKCYNKEIKNVCKMHEQFNSTVTRDIRDSLNNWLDAFYQKHNYKVFDLRSQNIGLRYKVIITKLMNGGILAPQMNVLNPLRINDEQENVFVQDKDHNYQVKFSSNKLSEASSFKSYMETKLIRYIILCSLTGNIAVNRETWRFIPDPGAFDHIFTDAELYKKYGLTPEEINIIESVIKERK